MQERTGPIRAESDAKRNKQWKDQRIQLIYKLMLFLCTASDDYAVLIAFHLLGSNMEGQLAIMGDLHNAVRNMLNNEWD